MKQLQAMRPGRLKSRIGQLADLDSCQNWISDVIAMIFLFAFPLSLIPTIPIYLAERHYILIVLDVWVYLVLIGCNFIFPCGYRLRRFLWVAVCYVLAFSFLFVLGPGYARAAWLVLCAVVAVLVLDTRAAVAASIFNAAILVLFYILVGPDNPAWAAAHRAGPGHWAMFAVNTSLIALAASLPVGFLIGRLDAALKNETAARDRLVKESRRLSETNEVLEQETAARQGSLEALRESETRLGLLADNLPNAMVYQLIMEPDGARRFTYVSGTIERLNEVSPQEVLADPGVLYGQVLPESLVELSAREEDSLARMTTFRCEIQCRLPSGRVRWFDLSSTPRKLPDGRVIWDGVQVDVTERKLAERSLAEERERFQVLADESPLGVSTVEADGRYKYINKKFKDMFGYTLEDIPTGRAWMARAFPDDWYRSVVIQAWKDDLREVSPGESRPRTFSVTCRNGERKVVLFMPVTLAGGDQFIIYQDVTENMRAEASLRESEQRYRSLFEAAGEAIFLVSGDRFTDCNTKALEMFGCDRDRIVDRPPYDFSPEFQPDGQSSVEKARALIDRALVGQPQVFSWLHTRYDGTPFEAEVSLSRVELRGRPHVLAMVRDVTERMAAERELTEARALLMAAIEQSPAGIMVADAPDSRIRHCNAAALDILGETDKDVVGYALDRAPENWQAFYPDGRAIEPKDLPLTQAVLFGRTFSNQRLLVRRADGEERTALVNAAPIRDAQGRITAGIVLFLDITALVRMERESRLLEGQLRQSQKMEAIGTLAGGVAHDFNNILSAIFGYAELLEMRMAGDDQASHYLENIYKASERARDLVRQILTFSRRTERELRPVRIELLAKEALKLLRASLPATIAIVPEIESESLVMGDPTQIHQVIMNLCTNAGQAMEQNGGTLKVELGDVELDDDDASRYPDLEPGPYVRLVVSDTGNGMGPQVLARVFEPFFTTKKRGEGTGMGLAVTHGIVKTCGGHILAESEPGRGATFTVYLPRVRKSDIPERPRQAPPPRGSERILLVDDEPDLVETTKQLLTLLGYEVRGATDGLAALEWFKADPTGFDLVLADVIMPGMTGDELAVQLRAARPDLPIILCSGFSKKITAVRLQELGVHSLLMKPFALRELAAAIRGALDGRP
ncbi:MAG: PAS domain S-box protein, partial [Proteobacteria bacterium]|nr:PAS domain S-box protein [Pseudomonadota bacterium]